MGRYAVPPGRIVKGWTVRLEPTPEQAARFKRDDGARRFAANWAVEQTHQALSAGAHAPPFDAAIWSHYELRKRWNRVKSEIAPWWAECSQEAYSNGIADAVAALKNWQASRTGGRQGPRMGFPRFRKKGRDPVRCTYTTGALRVDDVRRVVLPGVGRVQTGRRTSARSGVTSAEERDVCCQRPSGKRVAGGASRSGWRSSRPGSPYRVRTPLASMPGSGDQEAPAKAAGFTPLAQGQAAGSARVPARGGNPD